MMAPSAGIVEVDGFAAGVVSLMTWQAATECAQSMYLYQLPHASQNSSQKRQK